MNPDTPSSNGNVVVPHPRRSPEFWAIITVGVGLATLGAALAAVILTGLSTAAEDRQAIRADLQSVRSDLHSVRADLQSVRADLQSLGERVARLEGAFAYLRPLPASTPDSE